MKDIEKRLNRLNRIAIAAVILGVIGIALRLASCLEGS